MRTLPRSSPSDVHRSRGRRHRARRARAFVAYAGVSTALVLAVAVGAARWHTDTGPGAVAVRVPVASSAPMPPPAPGTSRANPWPIGTAAAIEGWRVKVIGVTADADPEVAFDAAPRPGYRWVAVSLHLARSGRGGRRPSIDMTWSYVARDGRAYDAQPAGLPDDLHALGAMRHGARANGSLAFQVASSEVGDGVLSIGFTRILRPAPVVGYWALS
jgi:hypothetical protein